MENSMEPVHIEHTAGSTHLTLGAALGIADGALAAAAPVVIDASRVEHLDAAVMQVLTGFCRAARERSQAVSWNRPSPVLLQAVRLLGLESILEMS
jgi:anti-anti-sigma regulatory factor